MQYNVKIMHSFFTDM